MYRLFHMSTLISRLTGKRAQSADPAAGNRFTRLSDRSAAGQRNHRRRAGPGLPGSARLLAVCLAVGLTAALLSASYLAWPGLAAKDRQNLLVAAAADGQADRTGVLTYLEQASDDLLRIRAIVADPGLAIFDDSDSDEELTRESIAQTIDLLTGHRQTAESLLAALVDRPLPDLAVLDQYRQSEAALLSLLIDLLLEFEQILHYSDVLMLLGEDLQSLSYFDENDLEGTYQVIQTALTEGIELLRSQNVPSFLTGMHEDLIDALAQMDDAVRYTLIGVALYDPLRIDSADYRMEILMRRFDTIMSRVDKDMEDRQTKLAEEVDRVNTWQDGLEQWVSDNIAIVEKAGEVSP